MASSAGIERPAPAPGAAGRTAGAGYAIVGVLGFSFKAILVKLAYAAAPVDTTTLLTLRMLYSAPLFAAMAWWAGRQPGARRFEAGDWRSLAVLGFVGYYLASLADFLGLQYIGVSLERLILFAYPTIVVLLSAMFHKRPITRRTAVALVLSYAGIGCAFFGDFRAGGDAGATLLGSALVFAGALLYAIYLVGSTHSIARLGSLRFVAWAMLASTIFIVVQFVLTRPVSALEVPARVHVLSMVMAVFSTVLPTWLIAESIRRLGASTSSLIGTLGPIFTIGLGVLILDEPLAAPQIAGAALVLAGVALVTRR